MLGRKVRENRERELWGKRKRGKVREIKKVNYSKRKKANWEN